LAKAPELFKVGAHVLGLVLRVPAHVYRPPLFVMAAAPPLFLA
jgi:hypothetical protein